MKIILTVEYRGKVYEQPNCRIKVDQNGGVSALVKIDDSFKGVKAKVTILEIND